MKTKVICVGIKNQSTDLFEKAMEELRQLCHANDMEVVASFQQVLASENSSTYLGSGKIEEIKLFCEEEEVDTVVTLHDLSPSQLRNLDEALDLAVFDRTSIILNIFASRAKSKEARLQVDLARLQYELPRMIGSYEALSRQAGSSGSMRSRGTGETKLEMDRRHLQGRIQEMKKELESIKAQRAVQRRRRSKQGLFHVALVGYTNAGKSTLMNQLLSMSKLKQNEKEVWVFDQLFATLDTSVRRLEIEGYPPLLCSDTVGFVQDLPTTLIEAFHSTLEEAIEADVLLHVVDFSDENYSHHIKVTRDTLKVIQADAPEILVLNKTDQTNAVVMNNGDVRVYISALTGLGMDELMKRIFEVLFRHGRNFQCMVPYHDAQDYFLMKVHGLLQEDVKTDAGYRISGKFTQEVWSLCEKHKVKQ